MSTSNFVRQPENVTCQPGPFWVPCLCALLFVVCGERTVWAFASGLGDDCTINAETRENPSPAFAIPEQEVIATIGATYDDPTEHEECMIAKRTFKWRIVEVLVRSYSSSDFVPSTYRPELDHPSTSDPNATITGKFPQPGKWRVRLELTANWQGTAGCGSCGCGPDELEVWFNVVGVKMQSLTYNSDQGVLKDKNDDYEAGGTTYGPPEWRRFPDGTVRSYPISHTKNSQVAVTLAVEFECEQIPGMSVIGIRSGPDYDMRFESDWRTVYGSFPSEAF